MYRPNPFHLSTLHKWIDEALKQVKKSPKAEQVMKHIHNNHPGVLFSPHWFTVQFKKYQKNQIKKG